MTPTLQHYDLAYCSLQKVLSQFPQDRSGTTMAQAANHVKQQQLTDCAEILSWGRWIRHRHWLWQSCKQWNHWNRANAASGMVLPSSHSAAGPYWYLCIHIHTAQNTLTTSSIL